MYQFIIYKIAQLLSLFLPLKAGYAIAAFLARCQFYFSRKDRKMVSDNLKAVLDTRDEAAIRKVAKEVFVNFAKYLVDFFRFSKLTKEYIAKNVKLIGRDNLDAAIKRKKGVILLTAHIGNYELGGAAVSLLGYTFNAVALDHKNKLVNNFFIRQRQTANINVIPLGMALKRCYACLKRGEALALLGDRDFLNHGLKMKFFGRDSLIPKGTAVLSLRTAASIIPTFFIRMPDDTFELTFERPITYSATGGTDEDTQLIMKKGIEVMERYIKRYPSQWYMFRNFWI
ncbi:MAG: lysophospholipid acyltransferase family protein [Candidatus Omnitrophota bacterium]|nr:lysophospholipid acyltransferase family protein [Candidatus Omnitrophota bacterium]